MKKSSLILLVCIMSLSSFSWARTKVIYGEDDRVDLEDSSNVLYTSLAKSTAAMIEYSKLQEFNSMQVKVTGKTLEQRGICSTERFSQQVTAANCSGFLVGKDLLVTAGHCIKSQFDCDKSAWVFDYKVQNENDSEVIVDKSSVYKCKKIVSQKLERSSKIDYAVIQLSSSVEDRPILKYRKTGKPSVGDDLVVIGHPSGLPTKIADGAKVREINDVFLLADLDTYGGNSGSAVFNASSGVIEGILVRGAKDYITDPTLGCRVSNVLGQEEGEGEGVTLITIVEGLDFKTPEKPEPVPEIEEPEVELPSTPEVEEPEVEVPSTPEVESPKPPRRLSFFERLIRLLLGKK